MNKELYLLRIGYSGNVKPSLEVLSELQRMHLLHVPFENLDIHNGIPIELEVNKLYVKIIINRRGGFCYELNGLFYELLNALSFNVKRISARVYDKEKGYGKEYDHLAILVTIDSVEYLSDVGFGEFALLPLKIEPGVIQDGLVGDYIIHKQENNYYQVSKSENGQLKPEYIFTDTARELNEFKEMCWYHQTNPQSHFTQKKLITIATPDGRITLTGDNLKIWHAGLVNEIDLEDESVFRSMLMRYFNIRMDSTNNLLLSTVDADHCNIEHNMQAVLHAIKE